MTAWLLSSSTTVVAAVATTSFIARTPTARTYSSLILKYQQQQQQQQQNQRLATALSSHRSSMSSKVTATHYESHTADSYEEAYFYEPGAYMEHLVQLVGTRLGMDQASPHCHRRVLDIGGGTGNFAQAMLDAKKLGNDTSKQQEEYNEMVVVDPFLGPTTSHLGGGGDDNGIVRFVKAPAEAFLTETKPSSSETNDDKDDDDEWWRRDVSQILLKEVVHHLDDRVGIFRGMYNDLTEMPSSSSIPSILIITRPQIDIDYPLWDAARQVWKDNQPSGDTLREELSQAGFVAIQETMEPYPCSIALNKWQSMVQNRFWSTFSNFNDDELREASLEIIPKEWKDRIDEDDILHFEDRLVFITARKQQQK